MPGNANFRKYLPRKSFRRRLLWAIIIGVYYFSLPRELFHDPYATVIESREGVLLGARIAEDMQWRFPEMDSLPAKFRRCILTKEDKYFYRHPGFNPVSIVKALIANIKAGKVVRGGSTLTQQVIRLSRKNRKRTYGEKLKEIILATRLEWRYSKDKILSLYASHAPFGGNTVGLEAAAWRYFGVPPSQLSWAESATLAVLPNAPGLIHPGKNRTLLRTKRDRLLETLYRDGDIDSLTYSLAIREPLPGKIKPLPGIAPHLLGNLAERFPAQRIRTSIDATLQRRVNRTVARHYRKLSQNRIFNAAVLVVEVPTRKIIAYTGNTPCQAVHQKDVDIIDKPRSTGSIMKPFLYAAMLDAGEMMPNSLIPDIPTDISGYRPENFDLKYRGAVPAGAALQKSLNIPAVRMLRTYGMKRFYRQLQKLKLRHINKGAEYYGLSVILGGAESSLYDLVRVYTAFASTLNHYDLTQGKYYAKELSEISALAEGIPDFGEIQRDYPLFNAGAIYTTFDVLRHLDRPGESGNWEFFDHEKNIAWKTGTSFGFRDAWAIGVTPEYVVGVWVGNADGEGRPELTGQSAAAPLMFDVFDLLPETSWFAIPYDEMRRIPVCRESGYRQGPACEIADSVYVPRTSTTVGSCPYHQTVMLDASGMYRVSSECEQIANMHGENFFILPPLQAYYYKKSHPSYRPLPPYKPGCDPATGKVMAFEGIAGNEKRFQPDDFGGARNPVILKIKHNDPDAKLFWYVDGQYRTTTEFLHEVAWQLEPGTHKIVVVDGDGNEINKILTIF